MSSCVVVVVVVTLMPTAHTTDSLVTTVFLINIVGRLPFNLTTLSVFLCIKLV